MLLILSALGMLILIVLLFLFFRRFTIVRINLNSMNPTLKDGQYRLLDRLYFKKIREENLILSHESYLNKRIFVYVPEDSNRAVIKRLIYMSFSNFPVNDEVNMWFEGDNPKESLDSRNYGFIPSGRVYGDLVDTKTFFKRLFTIK